MKRTWKPCLAAIVATGLLVAGAHWAAADTAAGPEVVTTGQGPVRGTVADDHRSFLGIPYATAGRFEAPEPAASWDDVRDATAPGPACAQAKGNEVGIPGKHEDCLNLNVYTPPASAGDDVPVMVWIHGGSFKYGAGSMYDASRFAAANHIVVVTINYRLGLLGSLAHPALDGPDGAVRSGEYGLQDQQAALRWVRDNASAFGADPDNVTLAGESAGSYSTCAQLASPSAAGLFDRAIMQSAPCGQTWATSRADGEARGKEVARKLGCADASDIAACLRNADIDTILKVTEDYPITPPVVGGPELPMDPTRALERGKFNRVPVMQGINHDEYQLMVAGQELATGHALTAAEYATAIDKEFGDDAAKVLRAYPPSGYDTPSQAMAAVQTDHKYAYGAALTNGLLGRCVPTYAYEFAERDTPWLAGLPEPSFAPGSYHLLDTAYLFTVDFIAPLSQRQNGTAYEMRSYWAAFAATGKPHPSGLPAWHRYTPTGKYTQSLSGDRIGRTDFRTEHHYRLWSRLTG